MAEPTDHKNTIRLGKIWDATSYSFVSCLIQSENLVSSTTQVDFLLSFNVSNGMSDISSTNFELFVLELFCKKNDRIELSPKNIDQELEVGIERVIDLFLELELKGLLKWSSLDLLKLNLDRSTKEIYEEVYNSLAQITNQGALIVERYKAEGSFA